MVNGLVLDAIVLVLELVLVQLVLVVQAVQLVLDLVGSPCRPRSAVAASTCQLPFAAPRSLGPG